MAFALAKTALLLPIELVLNQLLGMDPASSQRLAALDGKCLAIEILQPRLEVFVVITGTRLRLCSQHEATPTTTLRGSAANLIKFMARGEQAATLAGSGLELRGNTGFAEQVQTLLREAHIDWEYELGKVIGDIPTQLVAQGIHHSADYWRRTSTRIARDVGDFLLEEGRLVPTADELDSFYRDIHALSLRLDRLTAKVDLHSHARPKR